MRKSLRVGFLLILFALSVACYSYLNLTEFATLEGFAGGSDFSDIKVSKFVIETLQKVASVTIH